MNQQKILGRVDRVMSGGNNLPEITEIRTSRFKLVRLFVLGILMTVTSVFCVFLGRGTGASTPKEFLFVAVGILGTVFFGLCSILALWQAVFKAGQVIYKLTRSQVEFFGIRDQTQIIPWSSVISVGDLDWSKSRIPIPIRKGGAQMVMLEMTEQSFDKLATSTASRSMINFTKMAGYCGVALPCSSTDMKYEDFKAIVTAYFSGRTSGTRWS